METLINILMFLSQKNSSRGEDQLNHYSIIQSNILFAKMKIINCWPKERRHQKNSRMMIKIKSTTLIINKYKFLTQLKDYVSVFRI